jgi:hypothetical protein
MNFGSPLMMAAYAAAAVIFVCVVTNVADRHSTASPTNCVHKCISMAQSALSTPANPNAVVQYGVLVVAIARIDAARGMADDKTIASMTQADVADLRRKLMLKVNELTAAHKNVLLMSRDDAVSVLRQ